MATSKLTDGPECITLAEAKIHLRVDHASEDALIERLIAAARLYAEARTGRATTVATYRLALDSFPDGPLELPVPPLVAVTGITYRDEAGVQQTVAPADYFSDAISEPGWVSPQPGLTWPKTQERMSAVLVTYTAGYAVVPANFRAWMFLALTDLYERRAKSAERPVLPQEFAVGLLDPFIVWVF